METQDTLYPQPPATLRAFRLRSLATFAGPGIIIASVTIGSGELVWASRSGAIFGYSMLWCFLYAGVFKAIQVYSAARHITLCGEHPMVGWTKMPGPPLWFPLLIAVPAVLLMPVAFSGIPEILGGFIQRLVGYDSVAKTIGPWQGIEFWINTWSSIVLCICVALAVASSYDILEKASLVVLGVMLTCIIAAVAVLGPNLPELLTGLFVPQVTDFPEFVRRPDLAAEFKDRSPWLEVALYLAAVGGGAYDYIGYVGMLRQKRWGLAGQQVASREELEAATKTQPETVHKALIWSRAPFWDISLSFAMVILVTLLFAVLGKLVLHDHVPALVPANNDLLTQQEAFLTELHNNLRWVYRAGVFLALMGTLYGAFEIYRHTFVESIAAMAPRWTTPQRVIQLRRFIVLYCFLGGLTMLWLPEGIAGSIVARMTFGSIVSGATVCGLWCFAMLWLDRVRLPAPLQMRRTLWWSVFASGVVMTGLGIRSAYDYFFS